MQKAVPIGGMLKGFGSQLWQARGIVQGNQNLLRIVSVDSRHNEDARLLGSIAHHLNSTLQSLMLLPDGNHVPNSSKKRMVLVERWLRSVTAAQSLFLDEIRYLASRTCLVALQHRLPCQ